MRNYKKYLAAALAATMVVGSSVVAQAAVTPSQIASSSSDATTSSDASGTINGSGEVEGNVSEDVFRVTVPTAIQGSSASWDGFDFVMDPQMLITKTNAAKYTTGSNAIGENDFERNKTLYFINRSNRTLDNTSDFATITNKSSIDVEISLSAEMKNADGIKMSSTETFEGKDVSMYMAISGGIVGETKQKKAIDDTTKKAELTAKIGKANTAAYTTVYDATDGYKYDLVNDDPSYFKSYEFALTGATNSAADWSGLTNVAPNVEFTWKVEPYEAPAEAAPSIATKTYTYTQGNDITITVDLGAGDKAATGVASVSFVNGNGKTVALVANTDYTFTGTTLTIKDAKLATVTGTAFTITFNDTAGTAVPVTINK